MGLRRIVALLCLLINVSCSDSGTEADSSVPAPEPGCAETGWTLSGATISRLCYGVGVSLTPGIQLDGNWVNANECVERDGRFDCSLDGIGRLQISVNGNRLASSFVASKGLIFEGHGFRGTLDHPGATAWLSNGFQSWSQSGILSIPPSVTVDERDYAVGERGDFEVLRSGYELSWWHTFVSSPDSTIVLGTLSANALKSWIGVSGTGPSYEIHITSGGTGETLELKADELVDGEIWFIGIHPRRETILKQYGQALPRRSESKLEPEAGWNSWYELWSAVDAEAVRANAPIAKQILTGRLPKGTPALRIVIDDGWQKAWGEWLPNTKFGEDMKPLVNELKADGYEVGLWLAPLLVSHDHPLVKEHPNWFLPTAEFLHLENGSMRVLDVTHPDAARHLKSFIKTVVDWGFDLLKIDFLFAGTYEDERHASATGLQAYNQALKLIREAAGPNTGLLLVGAPPIAGFDVADAWRIGPDVATTAFDVSWFFIANVGRTLSARWPYCYAVLCDGDPPLLRTLDKEQVVVGAWAAVMAGGALFLSDDLRELDQNRFEWLTKEMMQTALTREPSIPMDLPMNLPETLSSALSDQRAKQGTHAVPVRWRLPSQKEVLINFSDENINIDGQTIPKRSSAPYAN